MTVTYSLEVANTRLCGFSKLLIKWKASIYKTLWREVTIFIVFYYALNVLYRYVLMENQKRIFERIARYCSIFTDVIPLSVILGFYVTLIISRWWSQFTSIPWPDSCAVLIASFVHGSDERSRTIRRTLGRYLLLLLVLTFQAVSTSVKKRFPSLDHIEEAGIITAEERKAYEKVNLCGSKWWIPAQWFASLTMRARKEGRIKDSIQMNALFMEMLTFRGLCGNMLNYDWVSIPLLYTQVVTIVTYTFFLTHLMSKQNLESDSNRVGEVNFYVPFFTLFQLFFYMGWLKVAEQLINPYGEDDDDFELNWCLDRNIQVVFLMVDHLQSKHPKLKCDVFWDDLAPKLPHNKYSVKKQNNPLTGSTVNLEINEEESQFIPLEPIITEDSYCGSQHRTPVYHSLLHPQFLVGKLTGSSRRDSSKKYSVGARTTLEFPKNSTTSVARMQRQQSLEDQRLSPIFMPNENECDASSSRLPPFWLKLPSLSKRKKKFNSEYQMSQDGSTDYPTVSSEHDVSSTIFVPNILFQTESTLVPTPPVFGPETATQIFGSDSAAITVMENVPTEKRMSTTIPMPVILEEPPYSLVTVVNNKKSPVKHVSNGLDESQDSKPPDDLALAYMCYLEKNKLCKDGQETSKDAAKGNSTSSSKTTSMNLNISTVIEGLEMKCEQNRTLVDGYESCCSDGSETSRERNLSKV
ncbi:bestrophin-4-like [Tachypleus tridentatus]|uniref:bestrophin-4-like n=1 Tax=Tachypleus tridentatus TaxID=6853 RepID=UPI003FD4070C